jgi:hypothetical protein
MVGDALMDSTTHPATKITRAGCISALGVSTISHQNHNEFKSGHRIDSGLSGAIFEGQPFVY